jgi:hypothetical protein
MNWKTWLAVVLVIFTAGWMLFDGARALIAGDYVTPTTGQYVGQLGPWSNLVEAIGIEPRSTLMKSIFVVYGLAWARGAMIIVCILGLWFLPIGTVTNLISLILLLIRER